MGRASVVLTAVGTGYNTLALTSLDVISSYFLPFIHILSIMCKYVYNLISAVDYTSLLLNKKIIVSQ